MAVYIYKALDKDGREITGRIEAVSESISVERLRSTGYYPTEIRKIQGKKFGKVALEELPVIRTLYRILTRGVVKHKTLTAFTRQLATLMKAGLPLRRSLETLRKQSDSLNLKTALDTIIEDIDSGFTFSEALEKQPQIFNKLYVNMIKVGEVSGALETVLKRLAIFAEKKALLKSKVRSALIYPTVVLFLATIIVSVVLIFVVPRFQDIYEGLGSDLPSMTLLLISISEIIFQKTPFVIGGIFFLIFLYWRTNKTRIGKYVFDIVRLKLPVFGELFQKSAIARFSRTLGTLMETGVPVLQSLIIVKDTSGNEVLSRAVEDIYNSVRSGETVTEPMKKHFVFPPIVIDMIAVGEESGAIDEMLVNVADTYEYEVEATVDALTSIIEPLLIIFLGFIIGFIVIALYLPILNPPLFK